ncbi:MAG: hypothetical protein AMK71_00790 [Nitrospira bacterium SG8_35_4]|nr:MAG: hypothetical protein AMK71_00790 [Nitrospira bacterium SG8_35_4]
MNRRDRLGQKKWIRPVCSFFLHTVSCLLLTAYCLLLTVFLVSCGRRGDPVLLSPYEESESAEKSGASENENQAPGLNGTGEDALTVVQPQAPEGLAAVFAGQKIILVWDEVAGQGVKSYRIYRSAGNGFSFIGEVVTPVFNDRGIESGTRYFYKVSAVGETESSGSDTVEVVAGGDE